tara:strand:+ start:319 stop:579 length:261 start_codon:yes stop_codon:yes gene_type:complete
MLMYVLLAAIAFVAIKVVHKAMCSHDAWKRAAKLNHRLVGEIVGNNLTGPKDGTMGILVAAMKVTAFKPVAVWPRQSSAGRIFSHG